MPQIRHGLFGFSLHLLTIFVIYKLFYRKRSLPIKANSIVTHKSNWTTIPVKPTRLHEEEELVEEETDVSLFINFFFDMFFWTNLIYFQK